MKKKDQSKQTNNKDLVDLMIEINQEKQKMVDALQAIFMNTYHRDFDGDFIYKSGVLGNIKLAVGEKQYSLWEDLYS